jgi:hypothetical protein
MTVRDDIERNAASHARLRELVTGLTETDLNTSLGDGWTVKVALVHLAFWDGRQRETLQRHLAGAPLGDGSPTPLEDSDEVVNEALVPLAQRIAPARTVDLVLEAAEAVNAVIEGADVDVVERVADGPHDYLVRRWRHREEHIEQIATALNR